MHGALLFKVPPRTHSCDVWPGHDGMNNGFAGSLAIATAHQCSPARPKSRDGVYRKADDDGESGEDGALWNVDAETPTFGAFSPPTVSNSLHL